jgi:hypothetical protein
MKRVFFRIVADILLLISVYIFPWWLFLILAIAFIFYFESYLEVLLGAFILDALYGMPIQFLFGRNIIFLLSVSVLLIISFYAKKKLRFYRFAE